MPHTFHQEKYGAFLIRAAAGYVLYIFIKQIFKRTCINEKYTGIINNLLAPNNYGARIIIAG